MVLYFNVADSEGINDSFSESPSDIEDDDLENFEQTSESDMESQESIEVLEKAEDIKVEGTIWQLIDAYLVMNLLYLLTPLLKVG